MAIMGIGLGDHLLGINHDYYAQAMAQSQMHQLMYAQGNKVTQTAAEPQPNLILLLLED